MFYQNLTRLTGTLHKDQYAFMITSRSILLKMKKVVEENRNTFCIQMFINNVPFTGNMEIYCTARHAADDNMAHTNCILGN